MLRIKIACPNHRRYNPERDGEAAIRGGCRICREMFGLYMTALRLQRGVYEAEHTETEEEIGRL